MNDRHGIAQLHHVVHHHLDKIGPGGFEFDVTENHDAGRAMRRIAQFEFRLRLADDRGLVGRDDADFFVELADARRPAVENAEPAGDNGQLRHADEVDNADEKKIAVGFLADFLAQQRGLQVG